MKIRKPKEGEDKKIKGILKRRKNNFRGGLSNMRGAL